MDKALILKEIKDYYKFKTNVEFARFLGITPQNLTQWHARKTFDTHTLAIKCKEINTNWITTGEGEMLKEDAKITENKETYYSVSLLPISAQGGSLNDFVISAKESDCEKVISPIKSADFAMSVAGDSMAPEYPSGAQVLIKKINEKAFIDWGRVYVLDTCNGTVIKKIMPSDSKEKIKCVSINPNYPPFEISLCDIFGIYRVLLCMSVK